MFARIGLKTDNASAKNFIKSLVDIKAGADMVIGTISKVTASIKSMADESLRTAVALKQFHAETGADTGKLQMWQSVAIQANIAEESVTNSVKAIIDNQEKIKLGQGNISGYQLLGINPNQDPFEVLDKLREKTQGLSQGMKKNVLGMLGVNAEMIEVLDLTNDQFEKMKKNANIISPAQIELMAKADASIKLMGKGFDYIKSQIVTAFAPAIIKFMGLLTSWMNQSKGGFLKILQDIVGWIVKFVSAVMNAVGMIDTIVKNTIGWKNALIGLATGFAVLNAGLLLSPIGLFSMAILALLLVLDDMSHYFSGRGKSVMSQFMQKFPEFKKQFDDLLSTIKEVIGLFKALWNGDDITSYMDKLGDLGKKILLIKASIETVTAAVGAVLNTIIQPLLGIGDLLATVIMSFTEKDPDSLIKRWQDYGKRLDNYQSSMVGGWENVGKTAGKSIKPLTDYETKKTKEQVSEKYRLQKEKDDAKEKQEDIQRLIDKGISKERATILINQNFYVDPKNPKDIEGAAIDGLKKTNTNNLGGNNSK